MRSRSILLMNTRDSSPASHGVPDTAAGEGARRAVDGIDDEDSRVDAFHQQVGRLPGKLVRRGRP